MRPEQRLASMSKGDVYELYDCSCNDLAVIGRTIDLIDPRKKRSLLCLGFHVRHVIDHEAHFKIIGSAL